jgi:UDP-N-acetylmuramoylalanine-D-glutamate ligase
MFIKFALLVSKEAFLNLLNDFMMNITQDDLLNYMYGEASAQKLQHIQQLLEIDTDLQERLQLLKSAKSRLDQIKLISPNSRSVDNILNYAERGVREMHTFN